MERKGRLAMKLKLNKKEIEEVKRAQAIVAKRAQEPDFLKSLPEAIRTVDSWKI